MINGAVQPCWHPGWKIMPDKLTQCGTFNSLPGNLSLLLLPQYKQDCQSVSVGLICGWAVYKVFRFSGMAPLPLHSPSPSGQINSWETPLDTLSPVDRSEGHVLSIERRAVVQYHATPQTAAFLLCSSWGALCLCGLNNQLVAAGINVVPLQPSDCFQNLMSF